jgi:hypothetical protein
LLGIYVLRYPPAFGAWLYVEDQACVDLALYKSDAFGRELTHGSPKSSKFCVYNPGKTFFADNKLYLAVKNGDYSSQGAIRYKIIFSYMHAREEACLDSSVPLYTPRTTIGRNFLEKLYERIDFPRSGEDPVIRYQRDIRILIQRIIAFMLAPQTAVDMETILKRNLTVDWVEDLKALERAARLFDLYGEAERLLREISGRFQTEDA